MSVKNDLIRHRILLQRYVLTELNRRRKILNAIVEIVDEQFDKPIKKILDSVRKELKQNTLNAFKSLEALAIYEAKFIARILRKYIKEPIVTIIPEKVKEVQIVLNTHGKSHSLNDVYDDFDEYTMKKVAKIVKEEDKGEMLTSLGLLATGAVLAQYKTVATTAINGVVNSVHEEVYKENSNIIETAQWISMLDDSVCPDCEDLHGQIFPIDDLPACPLHANCRCELIPLIQGGATFE